MLNKILLVDDDEINSKIFKKRLEKRGFEVDCVHSGKECLAYIEKNPKCLVLLDIVMPEMDGVEVLKAIRSEHSSLNTPVLMLTANKDIPLTVDCLKLGANDYLTKPVHLDLAIARIQTQIKIVEFYDQALESRRFEAINAMVATYNHEINNPLTIAMGSLNRDFDSVTEKRVATAMKALERIAEIVRKIDEVSSSPENIEDCTYVNNTKMIKVA